MFSVIIPAYNAEKYILRSVESVLTQTYTNFELIVVNDGSKDNTLNRLKLVSDFRLKVISQTNQGVSIARNTGIINSRGSYICFLDADDEYKKNHLEILSKAIDNYPEGAFFSTKFVVKNMIGVETKDKETGNIYFYKDFILEQIRKSNFEMIWTGCICIKREMFDKYGLFEPGVKLGEDIDMWKRIYVHTGVFFCDNLTVVRNRDGSEATKYYKRATKNDPLDRMPMFLADKTISSDIKKSLIIMNEYNKLQVVRSLIINGNKKEARKRLKLIDKNKLPKKRVLVTKLCLYIPTKLITLYLKHKYKNFYME